MSSIPLIYPVILCGGAGTRLWPLSRKAYPKQFTRLIGQTSLFQRAATLASGSGFAAPVVVTRETLRFIVADQLAAIGQEPSAVLIEPESRNTAAAILAAALSLREHASDALMLVLPSDHLISDSAAFRTSVIAASECAIAGNLVTFGIEPTHAETGYGYLELADPSARSGIVPQSLISFIEKPEQNCATEMLRSGKYLWNAGIFLFSVSAIVEAYREHAPDILDAVSDAINAGTVGFGLTRLEDDAWHRVRSISIDYAIMEKASNLFVMPYSSSWSDLGDWESVWQKSGPDERGNVCSISSTAIDCKGSLLRSEVEGLELIGIDLN